MQPLPQAGNHVDYHQNLMDNFQQAHEHHVLNHDTRHRHQPQNPPNFALPLPPSPPPPPLQIHQQIINSQAENDFQEEQLWQQQHIQQEAAAQEVVCQQEHLYQQVLMQ